jgi:hypothetical protein
MGTAAMARVLVVGVGPHGHTHTHLPVVAGRRGRLAEQRDAIRRAGGARAAADVVEAEVR